MKIVHERIDSENFLEISLSAKEFEKIQNYMIISEKFIVQDNPIFIGVKLDFEKDDKFNH